MWKSECRSTQGHLKVNLDKDVCVWVDRILLSVLFILAHYGFQTILKILNFSMCSWRSTSRSLSTSFVDLNRWVYVVSDARKNQTNVSILSKCTHFKTFVDIWLVCLFFFQKVKFWKLFLILEYVPILPIWFVYIRVYFQLSKFWKVCFELYFKTKIKLLNFDFWCLLLLLTE